MQAARSGGATQVEESPSLWFRLQRRLQRGPSALTLALVLAISACGGDSDAPAPAVPPVPPAATGSVSGMVVASRSGAALAGVAVTSDGRSTSTAADGSYTLADVPAGDAKVLAFERSGHAKSVIVIAVSAGATARANARLTPTGAAQSFDAATGATVTVAGSTAQVSLPAAGLVTAAGVAAAGPVTAEVTPINPATDPANMPGNYPAPAAAAGGAPQPIESFGALTVTLKDAAGKALNLAPGKTATIRVPLATRSVSSPATVPLFYFDDAGARVAAAEINSYGSDYSGRASTASDVNCDFAVAIRKGGVADIVARFGNRSSRPVRVGPSQVDIVLGGALELSAGGAPPLIVDQPQSMTVLPASYAALRVDAVGSPVLRHQWRRNGVDIAGKTTPSLLIYPMCESDDATHLKAVVTNTDGSATSDEAVLTVNSEFCFIRVSRYA